MIQVNEKIENDCCAEHNFFVQVKTSESQAPSTQNATFIFADWPSVHTYLVKNPVIENTTFKKCSIQWGLKHSFGALVWTVKSGNDHKKFITNSPNH